MQKVSTVLEINANLLVAVIVALATLVTTPGHAAVGKGEIVANKFHQLVYLCEVERDDSATFRKFTRCLVNRASILELGHDYRLWRLGVN
jgi:hypothetical protein